MPSRFVQPLRILVQTVFLAITIWTGFRFFFFLNSITSGVFSDHLRPTAVEAFLPISGFFGAISMLKGNSINLVHPAAVIFFLTILFISFALRRSFCSWICPVGMLSELCWKLGYKLFRKNFKPPLWLDKTVRSIKYILLSFFIYSAFYGMSTAAAAEFLASDYHKIADARLLFFFLHLSPIAATAIFMLILISIPLQNPFCRYVCPYGALLGIASTLSPVRVTRAEDRCISCGMCSQLCPSRINVKGLKSVVTPECIGCWRCVSHCRFNQALTMKFAGKYLVNGFVFALLLLLIFRGGIEIGKAAGFWESAVSAYEYRQLLLMRR